MPGFYAVPCYPCLIISALTGDLGVLGLYLLQIFIFMSKQLLCSGVSLYLRPLIVSVERAKE